MPNTNATVLNVDWNITSGASAAVLNDSLVFVTGGVYSEKRTYSYDLNTGELKRLADMKSKRNWHTTVALLNKIYVCGGRWDGKTCEVYDADLDVWNYIKPMNIDRYAHAAVVVSGKMYQIDGWNGTNILSSMESYDPATNQWGAKSAMNVGRRVIQLLLLKTQFMYVAVLI